MADEGGLFNRYQVALALNIWWEWISVDCVIFESHSFIREAVCF